MAQEQQKADMPPEDVITRIWELAEDIDICMFTTWDGKRSDMRPLSARVDRAEHAIYFMVDVNGAKNEQINQFPTVTMGFSDKSSYKFVAITGEAKLLNDRAKIAELWNPSDKAWWDDASDPDIRLLKVTPSQGELWDSPGKAVATVKMLVATVIGAKPQFGTNAKASL